MLTRRSAIKALAIGAGTTLAPTLPSFAATQADPILRAAKAIAKKPGQKLRILLPRGSEANVAPVASAFSQATEVTIDFVFADVDLVNIKILSDQLTGADNFDIALPATFGLPDLIEANALLPLDKLDAAYGNALGSHSSLYDHGDSFLGKRYGFQTDGDVYVMFYRRSWLENADNQAAYKAQTGDDLKVPQTWTELDQQMHFFHKPENGRYGGALFRNANYLVWEWWIRLHANGGQPVDANFNPTINSPAGIAALEALIASTADLYPGAKTNGLFENWKAFAEGKIYCNIGWGGSQKYFNQPNSPIRDDLVFGPTPGGVANGAVQPAPYFNWGWNYTVARQTAVPELAYLFCCYAVSPDASVMAIREPDGFFDPFLDNHYDDPAIIRAYGRPFLDVHRSSMENCIPDFYVSGHDFYIDVLRENLQRALRGSMSAKAALDVAALEWRQITLQSGNAHLPQQWAGLLAKYPAAVRQLGR